MFEGLLGGGVAASSIGCFILQPCMARPYELNVLTREESPMISKLVKTLTFIVAVLCVVSTVAVAGEMTCTKADEKGCIMAKGADGKEMAVMGAGLKMGDKMDCMSKDGKTECTIVSHFLLT
jgi:hypothetical protein